MSKLWDFITSRFSEKPKKHSVIPLIHEEYKIDYEQLDYLEWKSSSKLSFQQNLIFQAYIDTLTNQNNNSDISFSMQNTFSGFRITPNASIKEKLDFLHLQKYIAQTTKALGYIVQMSEIRTREINGEIQTIYNIYMKPSHRFKVEMPVDQRFGNIQIELSIKQDSIEYLRAKTMVYQDRNYKDPLDFGEWVAEVFKSKT